MTRHANQPEGAASPTLTDVLHACGYTHRASGRGYQHSIVNAAGAIVFHGNAHATWLWLRDTGQYTTPIPYPYTD